MGCRAVCPDKFEFVRVIFFAFISMFSTSELIDLGVPNFRNTII